MNRVPFVNLAAQAGLVRQEIAAAIEGVLQRGDYILGHALEEFEQAFAAYCGAGHAIGVDNGLAAIELILRGYGIGAGDEVIANANTFHSSVLPIVCVGARPVLVEPDARSFNLDPELVEAAITPRTKAIIAVHLYGQPADLDPLMAIAERHGLKLIEDSAQAHGARYKGRRTGSLGHAAAFSFYPTKNLGAYGDGGAVVTSDDALAERLRMLRNLGQKTRNHHELLGYNHRLDTLQAAILSVNLTRLDEWNAQRQTAAAWYAEALAELPLVTPYVAPEAEHVYHLYVVRVQDRAALQAHLAAAGVASAVHYPVPIHLQPAFAGLGYRRGDFPLAEALCDEILSLPMYPGLGEQEIDAVAAALLQLRAWGSPLPVPRWRQLRIGLAAVSVGGVVGALCLLAPLLALAALAGVAFGLTALRYPLVVCYVMLAAVTLVSGIPRDRLLPVLRPNELLLVLSAGFTLLVLLADQRRRFAVARYAYVALAFAVLLGGTAIAPLLLDFLRGNAAAQDTIMEMTSPLKFFLLFWIFVSLPEREADWHGLIVAALVCGAVVALVGLLQSAGIGAVHALLNSWYPTPHTLNSLGDEGGRITSLMGAWNALGMLLMTTVLIGWAALQVPSMARHRPIICATVGLSLICLLGSGSFAGLFGLVLGVILIELLTNPPIAMIKKLLTSIALAALVVLLAWPLLGPVIEQRLIYQFGQGGDSMLPETFVYRFWIWRDVFWPFIEKHPISGYALDLSLTLRWANAESQYILLLFRFGLLGLSFFFVWVAMMLGWLFRARAASDPLVRMFAATGFALLVVQTISGLTNEVFLFTGAIDYMWMCFALVANRWEK